METAESLSGAFQPVAGHPSHQQNNGVRLSITSISATDSLKPMKAEGSDAPREGHLQGGRAVFGGHSSEEAKDTSSQE